MNIKKFKALFVIIMCFGFMLPINAIVINGTGSILYDGVNIRDLPSATSVCSKSLNAGVVEKVNTNTKVTILDSVVDLCNNSWYKVQLTNGKIGFVYAEYVVSDNNSYDENSSDIKDFEKQMLNEGFPESYLPYLKSLHAKYPSWNFKALKTNLDFNAVVDNQSTVGKSLISGIRDISYRSTEQGAYNWYTDTFIPLDGSSWYAANRTVVGYYIDPRNFLNEASIFMFENLAYHKDYQKIEVVDKLLFNTFMSGSFLNNNFDYKYSQAFMDAADKFAVSPIHLASRARQEIGNQISTATSGNTFTYNGKTYSNVYNFYNIGATSGADNVYKGLVYANGGVDGTETKYGRPWNSPLKAITGGAEFISEGYISKGQNTLYLQKFNVNPASYYNLYTHQYMTNIQAPTSESSTTYSSYSNYNLLNEPLVFLIPVYNNMPTSTNLPTNSGNPNNLLKDIKINNNTIEGFNIDNANYTLYLDESTTNVNISASTVNSNASVSGLGNVLVDRESNVNLVVTAQNGDKRMYTIKLIRNVNGEAPMMTVPEVLSKANFILNNSFVTNVGLSNNTTGLVTRIKNVNNYISVEIKNENGQNKSNDIIVTGDQITIKTGSETKTYSLIIYGDIDGDGEITLRDLLRVQKYLLNSTTLNSNYTKAADVNKDGSVTLVDLLKIQKHLLGSSLIEQ